jgi:hypothetical protein
MSDKRVWRYSGTVVQRAFLLLPLSPPIGSANSTYPSLFFTQHFPLLYLVLTSYSNTILSFQPTPRMSFFQPNPSLHIYYLPTPTRTLTLTSLLLLSTYPHIILCPPPTATLFSTLNLPNITIYFQTWPTSMLYLSSIFLYPPTSPTPSHLPVLSSLSLPISILSSTLHLSPRNHLLSTYPHRIIYPPPIPTVQYLLPSTISQTYYNLILPSHSLPPPSPLFSTILLPNTDFYHASNLLTPSPINHLSCTKPTVNSCFLLCGGSI